MTTLIERIDADRTEARKEGKIPVASFLGYLISEARKPGKDAKPAPRESTDEEAIAVVRKLIGQNEETLAITGGAVGPAIWQNKLLQAYLPTQIPDEQLKVIIQEIIETLDNPKVPKSIGIIMTALKVNYSGQYNPSTASQIAKLLLAR